MECFYAPGDPSAEPCRRSTKQIARAGNALPDSTPPTILWLRRDLRLADHPGWEAALQSGGPVLPVFILDPLIEREYGAAPKWRLSQSLDSLDASLRSKGSRLILRRGDAASVLSSLIEETGARQVVWSRQYDPGAIARDTRIKAMLAENGIGATSVNSSLLFEPWTVQTKEGGLYRVYTPFWKSVCGRDPGQPLRAPKDLAAPDAWPASDKLDGWKLGAEMNRGAAVVARHACVGETRAMARLSAFIEHSIFRYKAERDFPASHATSGLSENLAYGEISPRQMYHAGRFAIEANGDESGQAEHFLKEIAWREFAYHLLYHTPELATGNWRKEWDRFPWRDDNADAERWRRGTTGIEIVDAAMREMYVTGTMHNRTRMVVASFLTKHLLVHWKVGEAWFRECLIDWDPASNALGWQWTAGSGPDAAPFFRVFNPDTQATKFDPDRQYRDRFIAEGRSVPHADALSYFDAIPASWEMSPEDTYPTPVIDLAEGRARALEAYQGRAAV